MSSRYVANRQYNPVLPDISALLKNTLSDMMVYIHVPLPAELYLRTLESRIREKIFRGGLLLAWHLPPTACFIS